MHLRYCSVCGRGRSPTWNRRAAFPGWFIVLPCDAVASRSRPWLRGAARADRPMTGTGGISPRIPAGSLGDAISDPASSSSGGSSSSDRSTSPRGDKRRHERRTRRTPGPAASGPTAVRPGANYGSKIFQARAQTRVQLGSKMFQARVQLECTNKCATSDTNMRATSAGGLAVHSPAGLGLLGLLALELGDVPLRHALQGAKHRRFPRRGRRRAARAHRRPPATTAARSATSDSGKVRGSGDAQKALCSFQHSGGLSSTGTQLYSAAPPAGRAVCSVLQNSLYLK